MGGVYDIGLGMFVSENGATPEPEPEETVVVPLREEPIVIQTAREIRDETATEIPWLVQGLIAPGWTTEINGREKHGKGTLVAYLIGALEHGESTVFGPAPAEPVTALIYTEEPRESLKEKLDAFDIERAAVIYGWQLRYMSWPQRREWLIQTAVERGDGLIFVDNISRATATDDEAGTELARKVEPLSEAAKEHGIALLYDRHQRKSGGRVEDRSRGGTALAGAVEAIVTMERPSGEWGTRARKLYATGRVRATNWEKTVELSEDGTEYTLRSGEDFRTRIVREPGVGHVWTAVTFSKAIGKATQTARRWLSESDAVEVVESGDNGERRFRVLPETTAPDLD
jgi:hypothetical protein